MNIPEDLRYSSDHEWIRVEGDVVRIGITDYAQDALGDVVFVQVPDLDASVSAGGGISEVESTKSVSDLYSPVTGTVTAVNDAVHDDYAVINADPFGAGWLFAVEVSGVGPLMTAEEYAEANGV